MLMQMLGSFAEFEREMIRERTRAGLREARAKGRVPGRKPKITAEQQKEIVDAVSSGARPRPRSHACSKSTVQPCRGWSLKRVPGPEASEPKPHPLV